MIFTPRYPQAYDIPETYAEIKKEYDRRSQSFDEFFNLISTNGDMMHIDVNSILAEVGRLHTLRQALAKTSVELILNGLNTEIYE